MSSRQQNNSRNDNSRLRRSALWLCTDCHFNTPLKYGSLKRLVSLWSCSPVRTLCYSKAREAIRIEDQQVDTHDFIKQRNEDQKAESTIIVRFRWISRLDFVLCCCAILFLVSQQVYKVSGNVVCSNPFAFQEINKSTCFYNNCHAALPKLVFLLLNF